MKGQLVSGNVVGGHNVIKNHSRKKRKQNSVVRCTLAVHKLCATDVTIENQGKALST